MDQFVRREDRIEAFLKEYDFPTLSWSYEPWPAEFELGLLQLDSRSIRLQGVVLEAFIRLWVKEFVHDPLLADELEAHFRVLFDERTASLTRFLLRKRLSGEPALSLNKLAEHVCDPKSDGFRTFANRLIKEVEDAVTFTRLWQIDRRERKVKGKPEIGGYLISAGEALVDWERHVRRPMRAEQLRQFYNNYPGVMK